MELRFKSPSSLASGVSGPVLRPVTRAIRAAKAPCGKPAPTLPVAKCCCTACWMAAILGFCVGVRGKSCSGHTNRSEEHTSELQSLRHLVCRLLLEKKKKTQK